MFGKLYTAHYAMQLKGKVACVANALMLMPYKIKYYIIYLIRSLDYLAKVKGVLCEVPFWEDRLFSYVTV